MVFYIFVFLFEKNTRLYKKSFAINTIYKNSYFFECMKKLISIITITSILVSCSSYQKLLKNGTDDQRFEAAKSYFLEKKYYKSSTLFSDLISANAFSGKKMEETMFLLAESYMGMKDYYSASVCYADYIKSFPRGEFARDSKYKTAYCYYLDSPDARLDQTATHNAINAFTEYIQIYPDGDRVQDAYQYIEELNNKLAYKGYLEAKLYYNLGLYLGNNYRSAIISAENTLKQYPETKYREDLSFMILKSKYAEAKHSVSDMYKERFSEVIDEYYKYSSEFQNSKNIKEAEKMFIEAKKQTTK